MRPGHIYTVASTFGPLATVAKRTSPRIKVPPVPPVDRRVENVVVVFEDVLRAVACRFVLYISVVYAACVSTVLPLLHAYSQSLTVEEYGPPEEHEVGECCRQLMEGGARTDHFLN